MIRADSDKETALKALNETSRILDLARLGNARGAYDNNSVSLVPSGLVVYW